MLKFKLGCYKREEVGHALKVQRPVYFVSKVLTDTKSWYLQTQKLLYAVIMAAKKLQHYFTAMPWGGFPNGRSS